MRLDNPFELHRRCIDVSTCRPAQCFCTGDTHCVATAPDCNSCGSFSCVPNNSAPAKKGVSSGAVAGAVVAVVIVLGLVLGLFFWYRRRVNRSNLSRGPQTMENVASASDVLTRPDPNETAIQRAQAQAHAEAMAASRTLSQRSIPARSPTNMSASRFVEHTSEHFGEPQSAVASRVPTPLNTPQSRPFPTPQSRPFAQNDPFSDTQSIQTTTTGTQDAIPIALMPRTPGGTLLPATSDGSLRPVRTPESQFNMEHLNVSKDTFAASSVAREASGGSNAGRNSYMSSLTTATDFINEAPVIVTHSQRQVLGVSKAEVLRTAPPTPNTPMTADSTRAHPPSMVMRPSIRSPLAATSFGPSDVVAESEEDSRTDPFGDHHSPYLEQPSVPGADRPTSMATVATGAGTIIADISSAKRVNIGIARSASIKSTPSTRVLHRMTSGKLISPTANGDRSPDSNVSVGTLQQQQERALAIAHAKAREQGGPDLSRRVSGSSVITNSTRADSILESFPFVPPSPISNLPMRTPPRSPLGQQFTSAVPPMPPMPEARLQDMLAPNRAQLGMSTGSQLSTASNGLGAFTFQIASDAPPSPMPPSSFQQPSSAGGQRQRASLDTLALTSALSSYPLDGFAQAEAHFPPRN